MLRQSSSRCHRSKKLRPKHGLQIFLLVAVSVWLMYQLTHSYNNRRRAVVAVENAATADMDGEVTPTRRRLGRKGLVDFAGDGVGEIVGDRSNAGVEADVERGFTSNQLSKSELGESEGDGGEETGEEDENDDVYIAEGGLSGDDEDDDGREFHQGDIVPPVKSSVAIAAPLVNGVADSLNKTDGINTLLIDSAVSMNSSMAA
ncbi:uncharacterized protein LOC102704047 [Oryza brachyantha]|uniref:uncharacterized protein LOC102704047 n=1 Tax=Oryza brachyantha TaxID=4533 RepID=UPI001ADA9347|nr:uncharacterized protein LOC102704047 [Oryza brachyantha]XP_015690201.2 uncharacterized protein LOC102704047 [Oryza brachyantha]